MNQPGDEDPAAFEERRYIARRRAKKFQRLAESSADPLAWFQQLYEAAQGDVAQIPWADSKAHPLLVEWLETAPSGNDRPAIDIGCGLGDNAQALAAAGWNMTAFDLSKTAVQWARKRYGGSRVDYLDSDLFCLPPAWMGRFDLVHETYTLQALPAHMRAQAARHMVGLMAPGGRLLLICRRRDEDEIVDGPPWPLAYSELAPFIECGLKEISLEQPGEGDERHFRIVYEKPC